PYDSWEAFRAEARRLWKTYRDVARPAKIDRMAVRYVNRLDLPADLRDFKDYLRTVPEVSGDLPQALAGFFLQLNIPQPDLGCTLLLNEAIIEPTRPRTWFRLCLT